MEGLLQKPGFSLELSHFLCIIGQMMIPNSPTSRRITTTPGIGILVGQAWGSYFREPNLTSEMALGSVPQNPTRKAYDNMEHTARPVFSAAGFSKKKDFKRCAACEYQHYCSRECQAKDWRAGHRSECKMTRPPTGWHADHLDGPAYCTARDRSFLRTIIAHDYERHKQHIFLSRIVGMREHGPRLLTLFNYCNGPAQIGVEADSNHEADCSARAARSGGRMHINCVMIARDVGYWVLPTRSDDSRVHQALFALSQSISHETEVSSLPPYVVQTVTKLIDEVCPGVVEII
ncbi:hypothetical protein C8R44DRAFT_728724 [Mycena epipterygia]|nr:hypothetical protein C8R44DRAFT_728724 [Mycena epipterygia]